MNKKIHYISLDTCTWIYIVNGTEPVGYLHFIKEELEKDYLKLLLPELVIEEWNRHKNDTVKKGTLSFFKDTLSSIERLVKIVGEEVETPFILFDSSEQDDTLCLLRDKFKLKKEQVEKAVQTNIGIVEEIFKHRNTILIKDSNQVRLLASDLAINKKAPFIKKNSFADAIIILSFITYVKSNNIEGAKFISYNTEDFCKKENKKKELHPDLVGFFDDTKSEFYKILGEALNTIEENIASEETLKLIEELQEEAYDDYHICEECDGNRDSYGNYINFWNDIDLINEYPSNHPYSKYTSANAGNCEWCSTLHIKCPKCETVNSLSEYRLDEKIECEGGCGLEFYVDTSDDIDGFGERQIKIIDSRIVKCANCGEDFIDDMGIEICEKCESEYNDN